MIPVGVGKMMKDEEGWVLKMKSKNQHERMLLRHANEVSTTPCAQASIQQHLLSPKRGAFALFIDGAEACFVCHQLRFVGQHNGQVKLA
jgi:hypothetical protein